MIKRRSSMVLIILLLIIMTVVLPTAKHASAEPENQPIPIPRITFGVEESEEPQDVAVSLQVLLLITILALAPTFLIMLTSFTRIIIVLAFIRNALGTQQIPPTQVLLGLALFLTFFVMAPVWVQINETAIEPYVAGEIVYEEAYDLAVEPLRDFMFRQTRTKDLSLFVHLAQLARPDTPDDVPTYVLIPAFIISELKTAFLLGFLVYVPFLVIDMVVASILMSMGMLMLPPVMISLPLKVLLFVLVDGWHLITRALVLGFQ